MRKVKLSIIATVALGLLTASTVSVAAQDEALVAEPDPMTAATFTADARLKGPYGEGLVPDTDATASWRADFQMEVVEASDPRASGTVTYGVNRDSHSAVLVHAGTIAIENDDGTWAGTFTGYWDEDGDRIFHGRLAGQDGYEGWTMLLDDLCVCDSPTSVMKGVIIPGDIPPAE